MSENWCREQLANLQIKDRRLDALNEIRNRLSNLPAEQVASISSNFLTLSELFDYVEDNQESNSEQSNLACDILSLCMANLNLEADAVKNLCYLERSLDHANDEVKMLGLNEIDRICNQQSNQIFSQNIVISVLKCLQNPKEKIGILAVKILPKILFNYLMDHCVQSNLTNLLASNDLIRCRVFEVSVAIAKESQGNLQKISFVIDQLCMALSTSDILLELNVLEFLSELAQVEHGWLYLENIGIFKKITENVENLDANPLKNLLIPGYMKFFGNISSKQPAKIIQGFPFIINALFDCIIFDTDSNILPVVFDTLAQLGSNEHGKMLLEEHYSQKISQTLNEIGKSIHNLSTRLQIRALNCLEILFQSDTSDHRINSITNRWFTSLTGTNEMAFVLDFCRNPFPEIKIAALTLLKAIVKSHWGKKALEETAGFVEFLMDRNIEFNKDVIHEKYSIIQILSQSNTIFDATTLAQLKTYVQQGAFYVEGVMDVVTDGQG